MSYTQIDNILGQPIQDYTINQLKIRSKKTLDKRDDQALVYTANKSGWVRVVSSVDISGSLAGISTVIGSELAKNNVLFGGTSAYKQDGNKVSYEIKPYYSQKAIDPVYGFRPMPGITSAKISTQGKLGSILIAEIDFKANTKQQLDLVDILYFKIGYTMFIEWGNTFFYKQKVTDANNSLDTDGTLHKSEDYSIDPFTDNPSKESIRIQIAKNIKATHGNYCAMLGVVTNYGFTMNAEGGYDCKLKVMAPGMLGESMRVNGIPDLPKNLYLKAIENIANKFTQINRKNAELERDRERKAEAEEFSKNADAYPPCVRTLINSGELPIGTSKRGLTGAGATVTSGVWVKYIFFYDTNNPTTPTKGRYLSTSDGTRDYACDQYGNIVDEGKGTILGRVIKQPLKKITYEDLINPNDEFDFTRFTRIPLNGLYPSQPNLENYLIFDKETQPNAAYYIFTKFKKVIKIDTKTWSTIPTSTKDFEVQLNLSPQNLGFSANPISWQQILEPNQVKDGETGVSLDIANLLKTNPELAIKRIVSENAYRKVVKDITGQQFKTGFKVIDYDKSYSVDGAFNATLGNFSGDTTLYTIEYANASRGFESTKKLHFIYSNYFLKLSGEDYPQGLVIPNINNSFDTNTESNIRLSIIQKASIYLNNPYVKWKVLELKSADFGLIAEAIVLIENVPCVVNFIPGPNETARPPETKNFTLAVRIGVSITDLDLITNLVYENSLFDQLTPQQQAQQAQQNATQQAPEQPLQYTTIKADELIKTEQSLYSSQLEAMLRIIQLTTIGDTINDSGVIEDVKSIEWTAANYEKALYNGLFVAGAMQNVLGSVVSGSAPTQQEKESYIKDNGLTALDRYKMNLYHGFSRSLMKSDSVDVAQKLDSGEYRVNFKELLTSYVIPYYQSKNLIDGADVHYPTYVPLGFFFMMLNHCSFLYDTSNNEVNVPMFYLDFNPGSNIMLSSDFMLSANPYKFMVPFTGNLDSYKKLFTGVLDSKGKITADGNSYTLWDSDAVSHKIGIKRFKYVDNTAAAGISAYRGRIMNVLVSIDYLLDVIKRHAQIDETNSVYFRPMMEELLADLGKCLGNYNVFRLAYDDYANCFYVVDDQGIPGVDVDPGDIKRVDSELPLYGKQSIARSLTINTEMSSKLGSMAFISANQSVKNQSTLGVDGTSIGALSLYAIDRYKRVTAAANQNNAEQQPTDNSQRSIAASRFNEAVTSFYYGGLRSENLVDQAVNYYIDAVARTRATGDDEGIKASTLLPLSIAFSTDGISSMAIYQSFTVNDELLPYSYKYGLNQSETRKIGFVITGLEHTIQNNAWTTDVRANMYYVKRLGSYIAKVGNQNEAPKFKGIPDVLIDTQTGTLGSTQNATISDTPWSAAFISYVMKQASVDFPVNPAHTGYAQSLRNNPKGFLILNPKENSVQIGDIIVQNRSGNNQIYSTNPWTGFSHGDIVISLNTTEAIAIGGNVNQTVFKSTFQANNGILIKPGFFVILRPPNQYVSSIVNIANREYDLWKRNNWKELSAEAYSTIKQYYSTVSINV